MSFLLRICQWPLVALKRKTEVHSILQSYCSLPAMLFTCSVPVHLSAFASLPWGSLHCPTFPHNRWTVRAQLPVWSYLGSWNYLISLLLTQEYELCDTFFFVLCTWHNAWHLITIQKKNWLHEWILERTLSDIYYHSHFSGEQIEIQRLRHSCKVA